MKDLVYAAIVIVAIVFLIVVGIDIYNNPNQFPSDWEMDVE